MRNAMLGLCVVVCLAVAGCAEKQPNTVVVYTALDQIFSEPILRQFEQETGIEVRAVYDTEAQKTVGLYSRLVAEADAPQCDVWWNNEIVHTLLLKQQNLLASYDSPSAADIPAQFRDKDHTWTGFAARARVLIYHTQAIPRSASAPQGLRAFVDEQWRGQGTLANPLFGTTGTHVAALFSTMGPEPAKTLLMAMRANGLQISAGNATVRDRVAAGEFAFGLTDTDDAHGALVDGKPVGIVFPDADRQGTLLIPNTVSLIRNSPHPEAGRKLIDYLLSREVEAELAQSRSAQIPVRAGVPGPKTLPGLASMKVMDVDYQDVAAHMEASREFVEDVFLP